METNTLHCVRYGSTTGLWYGFIRPYNALRDEETYSLTFMPPSMVDGMAAELGCKGKIIHSLLKHEGMDIAIDKTERVFTNKKGIRNYSTSIYSKHLLLNPTIILAFEDREDADAAMNRSIYVGQTEYQAYPVERFDISYEDFLKLPGCEAIETDKEDPNAVFVGCNRWRNNEPMYVNLRRVSWE